ncbi:MAG: hypothetical protein A3J48_01145 [Candidatus Doudnabacteria bacterium RIFCSPHIGHO2_02_FULL_46_11]|uniref:Uncharacterized protein n=1 Tax=Candidatus Doudnabacteria bacterium RIFCSPHIGHO2_02_FULL_46_11 TaxID=1817832 RepID=A0A1F5P7S4_9BACT|nr:MAG: hypothetical protein A3J48_01145 [Candidatus Doudnabacteria bacterium RIFCSPHIGHO2_02_FULL_46_11]
MRYTERNLRTVSGSLEAQGGKIERISDQKEKASEEARLERERDALAQPLVPEGRLPELRRNFGRDSRRDQRPDSRKGRGRIVAWRAEDHDQERAA